MAAAQAIGYFTPEGERGRVPSWDPHYPAGEATGTPGTVFTTRQHQQDIVWTVQVIDRDHCHAADTRHSLGSWAGTVAVRCQDRESAGCDVTVDYDTTVLPGGDPSILEHFELAPYQAMMREWSAAVRLVL